MRESRRQKDQQEGGERRTHCTHARGGGFQRRQAAPFFATLSCANKGSGGQGGNTGCYSGELSGSWELLTGRAHFLGVRDQVKVGKRCGVGFK